MNKPLISSINIQGLFGLYSYRLPEEGGSLSMATILYGDNGVGKSTILRLVFHLLSPSDKQGHRTALAETEFTSLEVVLTSGIRLTVNRDPEKPALIVLAIYKGDQQVAEWKHVPGSRSKDEISYEVLAGGRMHATLRSEPTGEHEYMAALKEHVPTVFILNADRRLDSDDAPDADDEVEMRRFMHYEKTRRISDMVLRAREIALSQALNRASRSLSRQAIRGANEGSTNVHTVYANVLKHLASQSPRETTNVSKAAALSLSKRLDYIERRTAQLAQYQLETPLKTSAMKSVLSSSTGDARTLAIELLETYVGGVEGRLKALAPVYELVDMFIKLLGELLTDKAVRFDLSHGFEVVSDQGLKLEPSQLSSGEQQLLLLFCYVLVARDTPSVFMIDEPELSLNVKWQRKLVNSLLDITKGAEIQFLFASHSIELLSQHMDRVVRLESNS